MMMASDLETPILENVVCEDGKKLLSRACIYILGSFMHDLFRATRRDDSTVQYLRGTSYRREGCRVERAT